MLEVGNGGMTDTEYRTHFSLWAIMAAPLLIGTDLRKVTAETMEILLNTEVIAVDQDPLGVQAQLARSYGGLHCSSSPWSTAAGRSRSSTRTTVRPTSRRPLRNSDWTPPRWRCGTSGPTRPRRPTAAIATRVPPHGTALYQVRPS